MAFKTGRLEFLCKWTTNMKTLELPTCTLFVREAYFAGDELYKKKTGNDIRENLFCPANHRSNAKHITQRQQIA
jgi:hypothetical protein